MLKTRPCPANQVSVQPPLSQMRIGALAQTVLEGDALPPSTSPSCLAGPVLGAGLMGTVDDLAQDPVPTEQRGPSGRPGTPMSTSEAWPELTLADWPETRDTLHLWTQVVGKVKLALNPMVNHWWQVPLYVSSRGLTTSLMHAGDTGLEMEFDFIDHDLRVHASTGAQRVVPLQSQSVASFYKATMAALEALGVTVNIYARPTELPAAIPFEEDEVHHSYDPQAAQQFWLALLQIHEVLLKFRARFIGKVSPVHFFWGGADLCTTRFSGRRAPRHPGGVPNCPDLVQELAYSHEVSSCGYWPGGDSGGAFYAYAYPEPPGFADWRVEPSAAAYDRELGEFLLSYAAVRASADPESTVLAFCQSTYDAAATLAGWDRSSLEGDPGSLEY